MPGKALDYLRRLNAPRRIEDSRPLRAAVWAAVLISVLALAPQEVIAMPQLLASAALITLGSWLSWRRRYRLNLVLKSLIMALTLVALASFLRGAMLHPYDPRIALAELFVWVLALHSFDLPRRRDLLVSLISSLVLLALAGSFSLHSSFGLFILLWLAAALLALYHLQLSRLRALCIEPQSSSAGAGGRAHTAALLAGLLVAVSLGGLAVGAFLPRVSAAYLQSLPFSARRALSPGEGYRFANPGYPDLPSRPPDHALRTNPEAYFGFGTFLDLRSRGILHDLPVMKVRSTEPAYWAGMSFQQYNGFSWTNPQGEPEELKARAQPFYLSRRDGLPHAATRTVTQTYYLEAEQPNVIFASFRPEELYYPSDTVYRDESGLKSPFLLDDGLVYSVVSRHIVPHEGLASMGLEAREEMAPYLALPPMPERVRELAESIVPAGAGPYARALAIEEYLAREYAYSLEVPPLPRGADAVDFFLFECRRGYCEHFAAAHAVLCRLAGVPSRMVTGYASGDFNPFTGLYEVGLADAHAWTEIYVEGVGWITREPTPGFSLPDPGRGSGTLWILRDLFAWAGRRLSALLPAPLLSALRAVAAALSSGASALAGGLLYSLRVAPWLPLLLAALALPLPLARRARRRRACAPLGRRDGPLGAMRDFLEALEGLGFPRDPAQTAGEFLQALGAAFPGLELSAELSLFERARYGGRPLPEGDARRLAAGLEAALREMGMRAGGRGGARRAGLSAGCPPPG